MSQIYDNSPTSISPRTALAIAQVAAYSVLLLTTSYLIGRDASISRYRTHRHSSYSPPSLTTYSSQLFFPLAWIPLLIFTILRILSGALLITTVGNPSPYTLRVASAVSFDIGLPLLIIAVVEVLDRVNVYAARRNYSDITIVAVDRSVQFILFISLILFAYAGARAGKAYEHSGGRAGTFATGGILEKVATILTLVAFVVWLVVNGGISVLNLIRGFVRERSLLVGVYLALPFLVARVVFAVLEHLIGLRSANPIYGDVSLFIGLAWVEEVLVVIFLVAGGLVNLFHRRRLRRRGGGSSAGGGGGSRRNGSRRNGSRRSSSGRTKTTESSSSTDESKVVVEEEVLRNVRIVDEKRR